jgi:NADPH-dependent glutamate synthase beta subunit-like oxidoreductase
VPAFDSGALNAAGKRVVVIGGGDTAMDCVRTAIRQGAASVTCLYRRDRANMPGSMREVPTPRRRACEFVWLSAPEAFVGEGGGDRRARHRMHLGLPDATGRQQPEPIPGSHFVQPADLVIKALGFDPEDLPRCSTSRRCRHALGHDEGGLPHHDDQRCPASSPPATSCAAPASWSGHPRRARRGAEPAAASTSELADPVPRRRDPSRRGGSRNPGCTP